MALKLVVFDAYGTLFDVYSMGVTSRSSTRGSSLSPTPTPGRAAATTCPFGS